MGSFAIGMTLSYEDKGMIDRCLMMVKQAYGEAFADLIVLSVNSNYATYVKETYGAVVLEESISTPIFIKHQRLIEHFLDHTKATHFIKLDPDTIVLRWDGKFPNLAGEFAKYKPEHQRARWRSMPKEWKKANIGFERKQYLHGINGGYSLISREICEKIRNFFFKEEIDWPVELLRTGARKETADSECMIGEEHSIAWYLHQIGIATGYCETVDQTRKKYCTYMGDVYKIKRPDALHVFHPVKNESVFRKLLSVTGIERPNRSAQSDKSIALGLVVSYESKEKVECAILLASYVYSGSLSDIILVSKGFQHCEYFLKKYGVHIVEDHELDAAYFVSMEKLYSYFLENTIATHILSIDADTMCLRWDGEFPEIAGERLAFKHKHQQEVFVKMPTSWRKKNRDFEVAGCIHAIQGAYVFLARTLLEKMAEHFFLTKEEWNPDIRPAEEQVMGHYIRRVRKKEGLPTSLASFSDIQERGNVKYIVTPRKKLLEKFKGDQTCAYHPVKTIEMLDKVLKECGDYGEDLKRYLIERGIEL